MDKDKAILILFCFSLPVFLLLLSYQLTLQFYSQTENQQQTIALVQGNIAETELVNILNYTTSELSHLQDVQRVMSITDTVFYVSLILSLLLLIYGLKYKLLPQMLFYGGISVVSAIGIILLLLILSFNSSFTVFHEIFFPQGNWQFPSDSLLIQIFPLEFFINIAFAIFIQALCWGSLFIVVGLLWKRARDKA